jgi:F0F1-type ATP synthase assembly protein I
MSVSLEMVVPGLIGYWFDQQLGTVAVFTIVGFIGGMCLGMWHLLKIAKSPAKQQIADRRKTRP